MVILVTAVAIGYMAYVGTFRFQGANACYQVRWGQCYFWWGSAGLSGKGWLMPADTTVFTSYVTNESITQFVTASVSVFLYQIPKGTVVVVGFYVNGNLATSQTYHTDNYTGYPAEMVQLISPGFAKFTNSTLGLGASEGGLTSPIPSGSTITIAVAASAPMWIQVDDTALVHSYQANMSSPVVLPTFYGNSDVSSPHTLWVSVEANFG